MVRRSMPTHEERATAIIRLAGDNRLRLGDRDGADSMSPGSIATCAWGALQGSGGFANAPVEAVAVVADLIARVRAIPNAAAVVLAVAVGVIVPLTADHAVGGDLAQPPGDTLAVKVAPLGLCFQWPWSAGRKCDMI